MFLISNENSRVLGAQLLYPTAFQDIRSTLLEVPHTSEMGVYMQSRLTAGGIKMLPIKHQFGEGGVKLKAVNMPQLLDCMKWSCEWSQGVS